jgi:RNAse (barnase) inhibitor barstar
MRKIITIDGNNFHDLAGFYNEIDNKLTKNLNWKTGRNLDAFNDLLRGGFGVHEYGEPLLIKWINFSKSSREFGYEATVEYYNNILKKCHPLNKESVKILLHNAENNIGKTLMDIIIEIINDTDNSGHDCILETDTI